MEYFKGKKTLTNILLLLKFTPFLWKSQGNSSSKPDSLFYWMSWLDLLCPKTDNDSCHPIVLACFVNIAPFPGLGKALQINEFLCKLHAVGSPIQRTWKTQWVGECIVIYSMVGPGAETLCAQIIASTTLLSGHPLHRCWCAPYYRISRVIFCTSLDFHK